MQDVLLQKRGEELPAPALFASTEEPVSYVAASEDALRQTFSRRGRGAVEQSQVRDVDTASSLRRWRVSARLHGTRKEPFRKPYPES